ncbi:MAG TPA: 4-alpha-glucanotransferase [Casimicrobiaceae bacterium]|nr:4-alpha-glucanotransferase [Casimicrobiaceae bacterium]
MSNLERLAEALGVALEYDDIWGARHRASEGTLRALLAAMNVAAASESDAGQALAAFEQARAQRTIAPALVVRGGEQVALRLNLSAGEAVESLGWRLVQEDGSEHEGKFDPMAVQEQAHASATNPARVSRDLALTHVPPVGYHRLTVVRGETAIGKTLLIVVPPSCYCPDALRDGGRVWGPAVQLYGLRSQRNWGIGDFTDLKTLAEQWTARGAALVAINPLHALFPHNPAHASPYSPSSRLFLNALYLDVEAIDDFRESAEARSLFASQEFQGALARVRATALVDYPRVAELKARALALAYGWFRRAHLHAGDARATAFRAFCADGGNALRQHALFEALQEQFFRDDASIHGWQAWPEAFRRPDSAEVERFAAEHRERVEYYQYLQWQAALQLDAVARGLRERSVPIGLYADLAVSIDASGAEAWSNQESYAVKASVGAPPDEFNLQGQAWGLPPLIPERLREVEYAPFIAMLRANMRHAAALRVDHVMGLKRLFWVPAGAKAADGAYVHYPFDDLLGILALESQRHRCVIVGEDLGTVPDELRAALARVGMLSTRLLLFEREPSGEFKPPAAYVQQAVVAASSHDLPTLAGWWQGRDLELRSRLGLFPDHTVRDSQIAARAGDRSRLLRALEREALLPEGIGTDPASISSMTSALALAVHAFLARTPAQLMLVQLEDVIGVRDQANLPATVESHPNWRRKLALAVERWPSAKRFARLAATLQRERPRP